MDNSPIQGWRFVFDGLCLCSLIATWCGVYFGVRTTERGFFSCDSKLMLPYRDSTVPEWLNMLIAVGVPFVTVVAIRLHLYLRSGVTFEPQEPRDVQFMSRTFSMDEMAYACYNELFALAFGIIAECLIADTLKSTVGELRPHFIDLCQPKYEEDSTNSTCRFITNYNCTSPNATQTMLKEVRKSFPSNHSGTIFFGMVFTCIILQRNWVWPNTKTLSFLLMTACIILAAFVAATRVIDHKHFPHDVIAGAIIGSSLGAIFAWLATKNSTSLKQPQ